MPCDQRTLLTQYNFLNARPATGIQNPEPRNSSKKTDPKFPPPPPNKAQKILKIPEKYFFQFFLVFVEFNFKGLGVGARGQFLSFFRGVSGLGVLDPCERFSPIELLKCLFQKRKISPKTEVFGRTSLRTSGQKLRSGPPNPGKQAFRHGHAARTSTKKLRSEKLRADFSFPIIVAKITSLMRNFS